jgi:hypothetical protein
MGLLRGVRHCRGLSHRGGTTPLRGGGGVFLGEDWDVLTR